MRKWIPVTITNGELNLGIKVWARDNSDAFAIATEILGSNWKATSAGPTRLET